jgi:hypothetical protein
MNRAAMKLSKIAFVLAMAAAATGCAADRMGGGPGDDDVPPMDMPDDPVDPPPSLSAFGQYRLHSRFDIATNMPGAVGGAVNGLIDMTDDPNDPAHWLLQQVIAQLPDGFFKDVLVAVEPSVAGDVNQELINIAPGLVETLLDVGHLINDIAKNFGLGETLNVTPTTDNATAGAITIDSLELKIDGVEHEYKFVDYDMTVINATNLPVTLDITKKLSLGRHQFPIPYGHVVRIGLDEAIIPAIDPTASDLGGLLNNMVDCQALGQTIADAVGFGGASIYATACTLGLDAAADAIYDQIAGIDSSALDFDMSGISATVDADGDYDVDRLENGVWTGTLGYSGTTAPLVNATYNAVKVETPQ